MDGFMCQVDVCVCVCMCIHLCNVYNFRWHFLEIFTLTKSNSEKNGNQNYDEFCCRLAHQQITFD